MREGLDLPEVSLVAILDADKEGFLRSETALLQTCGRASRNIHGRVIMFADEITESIKKCIEITHRRRKIQEEYNQAHHIQPQTIQRSILQSLHEVAMESGWIESKKQETPSFENLSDDLKTLETQKKEAVKNLDFEKAAALRDKIKTIKERVVLDPAKV